MPPGWAPRNDVLDGGVPWESTNLGLFSRWVQTLTATFKGRPFFATVAQSDDAMSAVTFHTMTFTMMGFVFGGLLFLVTFLFGVAFLGPALPSGLGTSLAGGASFAGVMMWFGITLVMATTGFIGPWVVGGMHHLVLALTGAVPPDRSYSHTVRAHAYADGGAFVFNAIPYLGSLIVFVLSLKNHLDAYESVHHCGAGKALLAFFSPVLICGCCGCFGGGALLSGLSALF
ncbi:MAG: hypothetical protein FJ096_15770 [Deltaproteobacteria bacterium]|nr:hypothetical protein [Deltaproteobacteria bacterium]